MTIVIGTHRLSTLIITHYYYCNCATGQYVCMSFSTYSQRKTKTWLSKWQNWVTKSLWVELWYVQIGIYMYVVLKLSTIIFHNTAVNPLNSCTIPDLIKAPLGYQDCHKLLWSSHYSIHVLTSLCVRFLPYNSLQSSQWLKAAFYGWLGSTAASCPR